MHVQPCTQQHLRHKYMFISVIYITCENRKNIMLENTDSAGRNVGYRSPLGLEC